MTGKLNRFVFSFEEMIEQAIEAANDDREYPLSPDDHNRYCFKDTRVYMLIQDNYNLIDNIIDNFESKNIGLRLDKNIKELDEYSYIINLDEFKHIIRDDHYLHRGLTFMHFLTYDLHGIKCIDSHDIPDAVYHCAFDTRHENKNSRHNDWYKKCDEWYKETKEKQL